MINHAVEVNRLTKSFDNITAVQDVSFKLESNKIYGFLGRNGAGKTTIMQMLTSQSFATSGDVKIFGEDPYENYDVLRQICFIKESQKYPDSFRIKDVLKVSQEIFPNWDEEYALKLIEDFQLPLNRTMKKLSRGMLSAAGIVVGLASRAQLTIFDEPYLGLDAVARGLFYDLLIEDYAMHPRTIILSTHLIDEVSKLLEHIILIDKGRLLLNEDADALRGRAYTVVGSTSSVQSFITGKEVIHLEPFVSMLSATIMGALKSEERSLAAEMGLEVSPVSLQQLIVHMTKSNLDERVGNGR
ncbi:ABC transporter ATP-binding protein [Paenibacillus sp. FJAT-26967]|uniref:ABC transporter ATP-binding protein n=1 Tax=Paenibacillus sp. FJAT-26967 TaxID=1729690 RepID=UPI00083980F6|nr:ABC transporter ATP-binding protein [Paenibacillus sp. FJAT-26967]